MHLFYCIAAGLIVLSIGMFLLTIFSHEKEPEEERYDSKIRQMYPHSDDPEYAQGQDNYPAWKQSQMN